MIGAHLPGSRRRLQALRLCLEELEFECEKALGCTISSSSVKS
jgi:hypothetical protein